MKWKMLLALLMLASLTACGTKSDLTPPGGKPAPRGIKDPTKPPAPIGQ